MIKPMSLSPSLFLVSIGAATRDALQQQFPPVCYPASGLLLGQTTASGATIELFIAAPGDLVAFADMDAVAILKPAVLPLTLAEVVPGRINATLRTDATGQQLARLILAGLAAIKNPAQPAGVVKPTLKGK